MKWLNEDEWAAVELIGAEGPDAARPIDNSNTATPPLVIAAPSGEIAECRPVVWKHSCLPVGRGGGQPCEPPCTDPWQVDVGHPLASGTFARFSDAIAYAQSVAAH